MRWSFRRPIRLRSGPAPCAVRRSFAYSDNYLIDVKFGVIMDVEASRAIRQAVVARRRG